MVNYIENAVGSLSMKKIKVIKNSFCPALSYASAILGVWNLLKKGQKGEKIRYKKERKMVDVWANAHN